MSGFESPTFGDEVRGLRDLPVMLLGRAGFRRRDFFDRRSFSGSGPERQRQGTFMFFPVLPGRLFIGVLSCDDPCRLLAEKY